MDSFTDRLKSLGFRPASAVSKSDQVKRGSLDAVIDGKVVSNSLGDFVIKEMLYPLDYQHGIVFFEKTVVTETINRAARISSETASIEKLLFIDTETSGLSCGAGTFAFLVGIGRFTEKGFLLTQLIMRDPGEESALLLHLLNSISNDTIFVSFNGKSFDLPLLQNRFVLNRLRVSLREFQHLDMLHISRKLWRRSLESCALKDLETAILKFDRSNEDVPGWMIPDIYFAFLRTGDPSSLKDVVYHNAQDILSLAALFLYVTNLLEKNVSLENIPVNDLIAISRIYWELGSVDVSLQILNAILPRIHEQNQVVTVNTMLGTYYKKIKVLDKSVDHWEIAAEKGDISSCVELSMYYEHVLKDYTKALDWCEKAFLCYDNNGVKKSDLSKRLKRLENKRRIHV